MRIFFLLLSLFLYPKTNAQIKEYRNLIQKVNDTTITLQYFKNVDLSLLNKIDSFDLYLKEQNYKMDSSYFYVVRLYEVGGKLRVSLKYASQYMDYVVLAKNKEKDARKSGFVFGFFFYKGRLILCKINRSGGHLSRESDHLLTNLISENVNSYERNLILQYPLNEVQAIGKPIKEYCIEK